MFIVVPFIAAYNVANVGLAETDLPSSTSPAALTTLFTAQVIGRLADRYGKKRVFTILALALDRADRWSRRTCRRCRSRMRWR